MDRHLLIILPAKAPVVISGKVPSSSIDLVRPPPLEAAADIHVEAAPKGQS